MAACQGAKCCSPCMYTWHIIAGRQKSIFAIKASSLLRTCIDSPATGLGLQFLTAPSKWRLTISPVATYFRVSAQCSSIRGGFMKRSLLRTVVLVIVLTVLSFTQDVVSFEKRR